MLPSASAAWEALLSAFPTLILLYWGLAASAAIVALLPLPFAEGFRAAVTLSACRGKLMDARPRRALGPLSDATVPQAWFAHFYTVGAAWNAGVAAAFLASDAYAALPAADRAMYVAALALLQLHLVRRLAETLAGAALFLAANALQLDCHRLLAALAAPAAKGGGGAAAAAAPRPAYRIPRGRAFELVSCPHYLAECLVYAGLVLLERGDRAPMWLMQAWVTANLALAAGMTHRWYRRHFKAYPRHRTALVPLLY
eukprot:scaffold3.g6327.t1